MDYGMACIANCEDVYGDFRRNIRRRGSDPQVVGRTGGRVL